ncbi:MAG: hypothetical protein AseanaTS_10710 [Candidatus Pelagadaptatus aseana]
MVAEEVIDFAQGIGVVVALFPVAGCEPFPGMQVEQIQLALNGMLADAGSGWMTERSSTDKRGRRQRQKFTTG